MNEMITPTPPTSEPATTPEEAITLMREMLVEQAISLGGIFNDMTDYAVEVFKESPDATQAYIRLALRAQSNCRSSLRAMALSSIAPAGASPGTGAGAGEATAQKS